MTAFHLLLIVLALAFIFDFINGFHDSANSIATIVSTRVLTPFQAVIWAAFFNFVAYWISDFKVADTVAKTVDGSGITLTVIMSGLIAAIIWNLITWWKGIPSSSSHTLIGGFAGAAVAYAGLDVVSLSKIGKVAIFIFLAPIIGMVVSYAFSIGLLWLSRRGHPSKLDRLFKKLQLVSSALFSIGHGGNDAQKVMGIISAALIVYTTQNPGAVHDWMLVEQTTTTINGVVKTKIVDIPHWVVFGCYLTIAMGTMMGGWRIVKTMGTKITKMTPFEGVAAETAGAFTLFATERFGIPVSTTHTITGAIIGSGLSKRISAVKWGVTGKLLLAWVITIPISALLGALILKICTLFGM
ncbi:MAG: inorganic phosphate transporter [Flavobacteriales bacterium]|nr:inorganic phosphate transporter [Flavobacteriales bacterium]